MNRPLGIRRVLGLIVASHLICQSASAAPQSGDGEAQFNKSCIACHTIGGGRRVGPDLVGVTDRRSEEWLVKYITSSQTVIKSGDPDAVALFKEYQIIMPDAPNTASEILDIIAYLRSGALTPALPEVPTRTYTPEDIRVGSELFQGTQRFVNGGAACNSCHHVKNDAVIGGGVLAIELTSVFSRMGAPGIHAILGTPPFPVMERAYKGRPLTENEVFSLVAFLEDADQQQAFQQPRDYGFKLLFSGVVGLAVLLALYAFIWRRRMTHPVNHRVFARQLQSQSSSSPTHRSPQS